MCEQLYPENLLEKNDIDCLIQRCLKVEQDRKLSANSIKELKLKFPQFLTEKKPKSSVFTCC